MNEPMDRALKKKYEYKKLIGKGSYGAVTKATCRKTGRIVALKVMQQTS